MSDIELPNWEAFEQKLKEIRAAVRDPSSLLFRGQGDREWPLATTLDRCGAGDMLFSDYHRFDLCASWP